MIARRVAPVFKNFIQNTCNMSTTIAGTGVTMYGADWCGDCRRSKRVFETLRVEYKYVDLVENIEAFETVKSYNKGAKNIPVIVFPDGSHLTEPEDDVLEAKLRSSGVI